MRRLYRITAQLLVVYILLWLPIWIAGLIIGWLFPVFWRSGEAQRVYMVVALIAAPLWWLFYKAIQEMGKPN